MENPDNGRGRSVSPSFRGLFDRLPEDEFNREIEQLKSAFGS